MSAPQDSTYLGNPCKNGHDGLRYVKGGGCVHCAKIQSAKWHDANRERAKVLKHEWHLKNAEYKNSKSKEYYKNFPEKAIGSVRKWQEKNMVKLLQINAARRANLLQRTPKWLTKQQHKEIAVEYELATWCTKVMGIKYHVDHIVPLQGKNVSGLHVPWNLQVITAHENFSKGNRFLGA